ncbi:MAG: FtsH protease activity modulator HflK [Deltaproteobacteria bacterium]|nr:FtsH protease activity modulator HflK [Deltaproteobacteria bacterium]MBW1948760.1 FtsH protease activity modulator HflK [Deltaproteobacteria bacterium]MBW2006438.1 FtsH protease activity modulator HflK [Deltaproteobacteria bacterium]MBW2103864.1 FtsH protease activity modulator HflK [Deltaproteobacteria bacterium]MBW2346339.1 FtsH protease activity modulator HflK [Deltaproteobacteria bacterium]
MAWDWDKLQQQRKGAPGTGPPQMDEIISKLRTVRGKFPGGAWIIIILVIVVLLGSSCFYTVAVDEVGVVQRFGKYARTTPPGLNFKLPRGIEKVTKVKVRFVFKEEFGLRTLQAGIRTRYASGAAYLSESLMLTGDLNVAVVPWIVQFRIVDPYKYLFKVRNVRSTLRDLAESSMRLVVGDRSINEVISKRQEIAHAAQALLQKELDEAETGIKIATIEMKKTNVPQPVQPSFNQVNQAIQEKERMIYKAREEYNRVIPAAKGQAEKTISAAEGYALDRVNRAKGDASRFLALYEEYRKAKDVTRRRLYLEAILDIFPKLGNKYIIDADQKNLLPFLNMGLPKGGSK